MEPISTTGLFGLFALAGRGIRGMGDNRNVYATFRAPSSCTTCLPVRPPD
jgi:hypothetical protein